MCWLWASSYESVCLIMWKTYKAESPASLATCLVLKPSSSSYLCGQASILTTLCLSLPTYRRNSCPEISRLPYVKSLDKSRRKKNHVSQIPAAHIEGNVPK